METQANESPSSVVAALSHDHHRVEEILAEADRGVGDREWERAGDTLRELRQVLEHHMRTEEDVLFPLYEARAWRLARATSVMRHEHVGLLAALDAMAGAIDRTDGDGYRAGRARLQSILPAHHLKEEQVLYAAIDQVLTDAERQDLLGRLAQRG
jgi:iron-sulfur cluster repair protein YtfE (RIC family)